MWLDTKHGLEKLLSATVNINSVVINPVKSAKSLGMTLHDELKLVKHVATVCHSSYYQIRQLKHIQRYLDCLTWPQHWCIRSLQTELITVMVCLHPHQHIKLTNYNVLNAAARLPLRVPWFDQDLQIKVKDKLHWLYVPERVTYKLCTLVFQVAAWLGSTIPCGTVHPCSQGLLPSKFPVSR